MKGSSSSLHPAATPLGPQREGGREHRGAAVAEQARSFREKGLGQQHRGSSSHGGQVSRLPGRQAANRLDAHPLEQVHLPVFHGISEGSHQQQLTLIAGGEQGNEGRQCPVFSLGERGFNAAAGVVHHPHPACQFFVEPFGGPGQIQLDHFAGAGPHQKQRADFGAALQQFPADPVEFVVGIGEASQIPLAENGCAETGFGKNHHPCGALDQMGAGA